MGMGRDLGRLFNFAFQCFQAVYLNATRSNGPWMEGGSPASVWVQTPSYPHIYECYGIYYI